MSFLSIPIYACRDSCGMLWQLAHQYQGQELVIITDILTRHYLGISNNLEILSGLSTNLKEINHLIEKTSTTWLSFKTATSEDTTCSDSFVKMADCLYANALHAANSYDAAVNTSPLSCGDPQAHVIAKTAVGEYKSYLKERQDQTHDGLHHDPAYLSFLGKAASAISSLLGLPDHLTLSSTRRRIVALWTLAWHFQNTHPHALANHLYLFAEKTYDKCEFYCILLQAIDKENHSLATENNYIEAAIYKYVAPKKTTYTPCFSYDTVRLNQKLGFMLTNIFDGNYGFYVIDALLDDPQILNKLPAFFLAQVIEQAENFAALQAIAPCACASILIDPDFAALFRQLKKEEPDQLPTSVILEICSPTLPKDHPILQLIEFCQRPVAQDYSREASAICREKFSQIQTALPMLAVLQSHVHKLCEEDLAAVFMRAAENNHYLIISEMPSGKIPDELFQEAMHACIRNNNVETLAKLILYPQIRNLTAKHIAIYLEECAQALSSHGIWTLLALPAATGIDSEDLTSIISMAAAGSMPAVTGKLLKLPAAAKLSAGQLSECLLMARERKSFKFLSSHPNFQIADHRAILIEAAREDRAWVFEKYAKYDFFSELLDADLMQNAVRENSLEVVEYLANCPIIRNLPQRVAFNWLKTAVSRNWLLTFERLQSLPQFTDATGGKFHISRPQYLELMQAAITQHRHIYVKCAAQKTQYEKKKETQSFNEAIISKLLSWQFLEAFSLTEEEIYNFWKLAISNNEISAVHSLLTDNPFKRVLMIHFKELFGVAFNNQYLESSSHLIAQMNRDTFSNDELLFYYNNATWVYKKSCKYSAEIRRKHLREHFDPKKLQHMKYIQEAFTRRISHLAKNNQINLADGAAFCIDNLLFYSLQLLSKAPLFDKVQIADEAFAGLKRLNKLQQLSEDELTLTFKNFGKAAPLFTSTNNYVHQFSFRIQKQFMSLFIRSLESAEQLQAFLMPATEANMIEFFTAISRDIFFNTIPISCLEDCLVRARALGHISLAAHLELLSNNHKSTKSKCCTIC